MEISSGQVLRHPPALSPPAAAILEAMYSLWCSYKMWGLSVLHWDFEQEINLHYVKPLRWGWGLLLAWRKLAYPNTKRLLGAHWEPLP